jgi:uncharacterized membrane protein
MNDRLRSVDSATKGLILIPIAAGISGIALIIALFSTRIGYLFATVVALLAFTIAAVAFIIDFAIMGVLLVEVNNNSTESSAFYGVGSWLLLAGFIVLFL